ncbi:MAG: hypothetical protein Q7U23_10405 [Methylococcales bacterium]|nr:hypothetical protein [Methylococcales bacterium]
MSLLIDYLALCWFRNNPADLHPSKSFMWKTVGFYLVLGMIVEFLIADVEGILEVLLRTLMAFSSITTLLLVIKKWQYFQQLFIAIFICENFIMVLATATEGLYFFLVMKHYEYAEHLSIGIAVLLVGWYLAIVAYILRQAFQFKMSLSLTLAFSYFILTYGIPMLFMDM